MSAGAGGRFLRVAVAVAVAACVAVACVALWDSSRYETLASFSTDLSARSPQQRHNIELAASEIDGLVVKPGAEFSFNRRVGQCGPRQGYEKAPAIVGGVLRPEWGGGVCQVSSTLYNAVLLAGLKITERHAHSRLAASVPPGRDAATAFGIADLRFVNCLQRPVRISAGARGSRLVVSVLGRRSPQRDISIETETLRGDWAPVPVRVRGGRRLIDAARESYTVLTYRVVSRQGAEPDRELVSKDVYEVAR